MYGDYRAPRVHLWVLSESTLRGPFYRSQLDVMVYNKYMAYVIVVPSLCTSPVFYCVRPIYASEPKQYVSRIAATLLPEATATVLNSPGVGLGCLHHA